MSIPPLRAALGALLTLALAACAGRPTVADYADYEQRLIAKGKLRAETVAADAPFDAATLALNFERIALNREADSTRPGGDDNLQPTPLRRWQGPLRYRLAGSAVTQADRAEVAGLMARIARLTGLAIAEADLTGEGENFLILVTAPEERDRIEAALAEASPRLARTFAFWRERPELICIADNLPAPAEPYVIAAAMVVIGDETRGLLRRACLHEEIVQALGLANDHPQVRPSIFNDDGEFALLTWHDELLLRMLYDARLAPGMTGAEAMPVARRIAGELAPAAPDSVAAAMAGGG
jgi:hypothetical protein